MDGIIKVSDTEIGVPQPVQAVSLTSLKEELDSNTNSIQRLQTQLDTATIDITNNISNFSKRNEDIRALIEAAVQLGVKESDAS